MGCSLFECPSCHDIVFIGHTCKSRFCSSCGYKYKNDRVENILQTAYNCQHRQIVFTIPEQLRKYFFFPFENIINLLFYSIRNTIYSILNQSFKKNKKGIFKKYISKVKYAPGFFAFLHTFGRDLKWNPRKYPKGFYVYAEPKKFKDLKLGVEYLTRYCGRVPISENRIVNYDGINVTFSYIDHKDNKYHEVALPTSHFIMLLLRHILPTHFKVIRYYGFYRKKHFLHPTMHLLIKEHVKVWRKHLLKYQASILLSFNRDPYNCPKCDSKMDFVLCIN